MSLITPSMLREYATSLIIDPESRTIQIPKDFLLGVYNDKDVKYVPFVIPRFYEENDFGDFSIQVNYIDADKNTDAYLVTDPIVEDQVVRFNWILGRGVFLSHGTISFIVCFRIADQQGNITKEFNTTIHSATVLEGLEVEETIDPEAYSILANIQGLEASASAARNQAVQQATLAAAHEQAIEQMLVDTPRFASSISDMTDTSQLYIYSGNEAGFQLGAWYYYNTDHAAWELYGNLNTDTTLSVSGMSADGKATGDALALKANISDVNVALTAKADADEVEDALALKANSADVTSGLAGKVDKVTGKQLSTEDFTSELKTKLEGVAAGATNVTVDSSMSSTSTNPVQNKVINTALSGKLATTGDSKDLTTTFTSSDTTDANASSWTSVGALANTEKHSSIFAKVSQMFKNVRYLFKMLGTTDISSIGNGTISGALAKLNTDSVKPTIAGSTLLPSGADLNDYRVPGLYHSNGQSLSASILNCPVSSIAFRLIVQDTGYGYSAPSEANFCNQIIYAPGNIYTRRYGNSSGSWTDWKTISDFTVPDVKQLNTDLTISKISLTASDVTSNVGEVQTGGTAIIVRYDNRMMCVHGAISLSNVTTNDKLTITISGLPTEKYDNPGGYFAYVSRKNSDGLFSLGDYALGGYDRTNGIITLTERNYMANKAVPSSGHIQVVIPGIILFAR